MNLQKYGNFFIQLSEVIKNVRIMKLNGSNRDQ